MGFYRRLHAILSKGTVILCAATMGGLLLGVAGLWVGQRDLIARAGESLVLVATEVADKLDTQLRERAGDIEVLSAMPQLRSADPETIRAHLELVQRAHPVYTRLAIADRSGRVIASTDQGLIGQDVRQTAWFQAAWHAPRVHAETQSREERDGGGLAGIVFSARVKADDGTFLGAIMTEVDRNLWHRLVSETVHQFARQAQNVGTVHYLVVGQAGVPLLRSEEGDQRIANLKQSGLPSAVQVADGRSGYVEEEHLLRNVPVITGYARMQGVKAIETLEWGILVRTDREDVLASRQGVLLKYALAGGAWVVPLLGLMIWTRREQRKEQRRSSQARQALEEAESRTRTILDHAMDAVIVMDIRGLIVSWNRQAEIIFGWPAKEMLGQSLAMRIVPPQYRDAYSQELARYLETGACAFLNKRVEITAMRKDGEEFPVELAVTAVQVERGVIFSVFLRDITERTRVERQMRVQYVVTKTLNGESSMEEMAAALLEAIGTSLHWTVGVWWEPEAGTDHLHCRAAWAADPAASANFLEATRRLRLEAGIGLPGRVWQHGQPAWVPDVVVDANFPRLSAAVAAGLHGALAIPISGGVELKGVLEFFSTTTQVPDDTLLDVMKWIGTQIGASLDRRLVEEARHDSEAQLRAVVDHAADGIMTMNDEGVMLSFNPAAEKIFGYAARDVIGHKVNLLMPEPYASEHDGYVASYLRTGQTKIIGVGREVVGRRQDGSVFPLELAVSEMRLGVRRCFTGIVRDVTARKQMIEQVNERETFFRLLSEHLPVGAFEVNREGRCVYSNKMWATILSTNSDDLLGFASSQVPEGDWLSWFHPDDRQSMQQAWDEARVSAIPIQQECRLAGGQDDVRWVQVLVWPMASDSGIRYLGTIEDVTARKRTIAHTMQLLREGRFELQTMREARNVAELLAYAFPDPARTQLGLLELLINGVEHGNLNISYAEKSRLLERGWLDEEMARRLALPDYANKRVRLTMARTETELQLTIVDDGAGFDWAKYLELNAERSDDSHGRGIAMSKQISFDKLEYRGRGNHVVASVSLSGTDAQSGSQDEKQAA